MPDAWGNPWKGRGLLGGGPEDFGHRTRRCRKCDGWLCRYNPHPVCWAHISGPIDGVVIEVEAGEWRTFAVTPSGRALAPA